MAFTRRLAALSLSLAALLALAGPALAEDKVGAAEIALGNPKARVTVVEYASVSCPHCARFDANVLPPLKARYIDTGKVRYVFREAPIHPQEDTAGFLLARCAGPDRYMAVVEALFRAQPKLFGGDLHGWLMAGAAAGGLDEAQLRACISDAAAIQTFNARAEQTISVDKIESTPTVIVNGTRVKAKSDAEELGFADVDAAVRPLLDGRSSAARSTRRTAVH